jgi:hypothetical protein
MKRSLSIEIEEVNKKVRADITTFERLFSVFPAWGGRVDA